MHLRDPNRNWFEIAKKKHDRSLEWNDLDAFFAYLSSQVQTRVKKSQYEVVEFRGLINSLSELQESTGEYYPLVTFHATQDPGKINSIIKHGYLLPGDLHPTEGYTLKMSHGKVHGEGIYSSTSFRTAQWFSFLDGNEAVQLLVNWVDLGKLHYTSDDPPPQLITHLQGYNSGTQKMWEHTSIKDNPDWDRGILTPIHGVFANGAHTRMTADRDIVVSGSAERIKPIGLVTLRPRLESAKIGHYLQVHQRLLALRASFVFPKEQPPATFYRLFDDWHLVDAQSALLYLRAAPAPLALHHHLIFPQAAVRESEYGRSALRNFAKSLGGRVRLRLHSAKHSELIHAHKADIDWSKFGPSDTSPAERVLGFLEETLERITKSTQEPQQRFDFVYLFLDQALPLPAAQPLLAKYQAYLNVRRLVLKIVGLGFEPDAEHHTFKYQLQTELPAERLLHSLPALGGPSPDWSSNLDLLLEEVQYTDTGGRVQFTVPFPLGVVGEGFVTDLAFNPTWDQALPLGPVYKGRQPLPALRVANCLLPVRYVTRESILAVLSDTDASYARAGKRSPEELEKRTAARRAAAVDYARMLGHFCSAVLRLLARFRAFALQSPERTRQFGGTVAVLGERLLAEVAAVASSAPLAEHCDLARLRAVSYELQAVLTDLRRVSQIRFAGAWYSQLMKMRFRRAILRRTGDGLDLPRGTDPDKELAASQLHGWLLRLRHTEAAEAEPWLLVVDQVLNRTATGAQTFLTQTHVILPDRMPASPVERLYWAWAVTGNPYLALPSQPVALLTVAWVRAVELFFRNTYVAGAEAKDKPEDELVLSASAVVRGRAAAWAQLWQLTARTAAAMAHDLGTTLTSCRGRLLFGQLAL